MTQVFNERLSANYNNQDMFCKSLELAIARIQDNINRAFEKGFKVTGIDLQFLRGINGLDLDTLHELRLTVHWERR